MLKDLKRSQIEAIDVVTHLCIKLAQIRQNLSLLHAVYCLEQLLRWVSLCLSTDRTLCGCGIQPDGTACGAPPKETLGTTINMWFIFLYFVSSNKGNG